VFCVTEFVYEECNNKTTNILTSSLLYSPIDLRPQFPVPSLFQPIAVIVVDANEADTR
jgi:hypothetical protein